MDALRVPGTNDITDQKEYDRLDGELTAAKQEATRLQGAVEGFEQAQADKKAEQ